MSSLSEDRKPPMDYGVQIRFIKDLHETGGALQGNKSKSGVGTPSSKYGVAVRVQGVSGQPYVVLKEGKKEDSYGVQLKAQSLSSRSSPMGKQEEPLNPFLASEGAQLLRRGRSQDSLLEGKIDETPGVQLVRPPGDGRSFSSGNLTETREEVAERNGLGGPSLRVQNGGGENDNSLSMDSFPDPPPPVEYVEDPTPAVDTNSLSPVDRLISRFDGGGRSSLTRGRPASQLLSDSCKPPLNLVASGNQPKTSVPYSLSSSGPNPYGCLSSSSASSTSSLERSSGFVTKAKTVSSPAPPWSASRSIAKRVQPVAAEGQTTPDLLRDQGQGTEIVSEEDRRKQIIYNILREGSSDNDLSLKRKVSLVFEKIQAIGGQKDSSQEALKAELEDCLDENVRLQEQLDRKKAELHEAHNELTQLRMDRETAEAQVRILEDQRAELQEELRRMSEGTSETDSLQTALLSVQAQLAEASMLHQRQEETLRQRDRELTALKGALKDEVSTHDQEMEALREQCSKDMEKLRSSMEEFVQSQQSIETERQRVNTTMHSLQQQLEACRHEADHWRAQFNSTKEQLLSTKQELLQAHVDNDEFEEELKKLQEKLNLQSSLQPTCSDLERKLEKQQVELDRKTAELNSLKKVSQQQESEQKSEMDKLKEQLQKEKKELAKAVEKLKQAPEQHDLGVVRVEAERLRDGLVSSERELQAARDQLGITQKELLTQRETCQGLEEANTRLRDRLSRLESQLQSSVSLSSEAEQALEEQNRSLRTQLEEARRTAARVGQDRDEMARRLEERDRERESLRRGKTDLEEQKRLLDRALDKLNKEVEQMSQESRQAVMAVQAQLDEHKERSRRDLVEAQRQAKDRLAELQRGQASIKSLQEEVSRLKKELLACGEERDSALLDKQLLGNRLKHVEEELDTERASLSEMARNLRSMEDKFKSLEMELDEERSNAELFNERNSRSREQVDQLRTELMQERSSKQDLELDKSVLERQMKDLKVQVEELRDQPRPSTGVSQLESKIQEMEERLLSEEREKISFQAAQRRLERKLKELNITLDEERHRHSEQRDQMALRVKALKRQLDESEGEVERLEGLRRKALRETEEQLEQQEVLRARVTALEAELRRKAQQLRHPTLDSSTLSSDEEEGPYSHRPSIPSMQTELHLQNSSC
ncbi:cingulin-like isoform X2 [Scleropages formosus]|uniref:cingulin-like isoform X2 n=1 Tax=Scleropages formosus TaxID=113540 RepID=UPI000878E843|nr:cingulin-like isoform X2 [Scleropages formosus]